MKTIKFSQAREMYAKMPPRHFLWSGVQEKSFGLVFGPAKSGKTIFCENLAISFAIGRESYFGYPLDGIPKKVLFIGLEEIFESRLKRNILQFETLTDDEKLLMDENFDVQAIEFPKFIKSEQNWELLKQTIKESGAEIVFIDSITRMNHGKLEDSRTAEEIMQSLRTLSQDLKITLFAIHHTPKLHESPITMDSIKGSSVFAQESDFAIGIRRTDHKHRYFKNVYYRDANDDDEFVKEFEINPNVWLEYSGEADEDEILRRSDRRRAHNKSDLICSFFNSKPDVTYSYSDAVEIIMCITDLQERQAKYYLSDLSKLGKIDGSKKGYYRSNNGCSNTEGGSNE